MIKIKQVGKPRIRPYAFKVVRPGLPFGTSSTDKEILQLIEWLILNISTIESNKWELRGYGPGYTNVYFTDKCDAVAFKLRWS